jgi:hypothetical protein
MNITSTSAQAKGATMDTTTVSRSLIIEGIKASLGTTNASRILSALGHPGYGSRFSAKVLYEWQRNAGQSLHAIVYSGLEYQV